MTSSNPFPTPSALTRKRLLDIVNLTTTTYQRGWNPGTSGNVSVREEPRHAAKIAWVSPSGVNKGQLDPKRFLPICIETLTSIRPLAAKPSDETPLHAAIYRRFANARTVVHVHPPNLIKAMQFRQILRFTDQEMSKILGHPGHSGSLEVTILENTQDMVELGARVSELILPHPVVLLRGHGVYAWGQDGYQALKIIEGLEFLCQTTS